MPKVSVLMSVYNGERFLSEAVESILSQTFRDFEFVVIDDGSTDGTADILVAYGDERMRISRNMDNIGLTRSLNKGIELCRGQYIARMDADDISYPERLEKQVGFLDDNPSYCAVATRVKLVNMAGRSVGIWPADAETTTAEEIHQCLPRENCISHPSIMIRAVTLMSYLYNDRVLRGQDYHLWLRLAAAGQRIGKLDETLLALRSHPESITARSFQGFLLTKVVRCKLEFLRCRLLERKFERFDVRVLNYLLRDIVGMLVHAMSRHTKAALNHLLVPVGKLIGRLLPFDNPSSLFFIFQDWPASPGGGQAVHERIVASVKDKNPWVLVAEPEREERHTFPFRANLGYYCLASLATNRVFFFLTVGALSQLINQHSDPVVFGTCKLFYHLTPHLNSHVKRIEILHAFGGGMEALSLPFVEHLDQRVVIDHCTLQNLHEQYDYHGLPTDLTARIVLIENATEVPQQLPVKPHPDPLKVLFVGRASEEKRVHLVALAAEKSFAAKLPVDFTLVGPREEDIDPNLRRYCSVKGMIKDRKLLDSIYDESHVLVLTSSREGFPMVVMEAMARGVVPVCTRVGGIEYHVIDGDTGFLIDEEQEEQMAHEITIRLRKLSEDADLWERLSRAAHDRAGRYFSRDRFRESYRDLLCGSRDG